MTQTDYIKQFIKLALANDQNHLLDSLYEFVDFSQQHNRKKIATEILEIIKDSTRKRTLEQNKRFQLAQRLENEAEDFILQTVVSEYSLKDLVCTHSVHEDLSYFIKERQLLDSLVHMGIPVANKILLHGPSGCGKTLTAYVLAGELKKPLMVVNLGTIISSKLGETSRNITKIFRTAISHEAIVLLDEFDSLGKIRDYDQDHGEMKRVVNTILQLFDFVNHDTVIIAATNQIKMIDSALIRRFDLAIKLDYPKNEQIKMLIQNTIKDKFIFDNDTLKDAIINDYCKNLSYYVIKRALLNTIKRNVLEGRDDNIIRTEIWKKLLNNYEEGVS